MMNQENHGPIADTPETPQETRSGTEDARALSMDAAHIAHCGVGVASGVAMPQTDAYLPPDPFCALRSDVLRLGAMLADACADHAALVAAVRRCRVLPMAGGVFVAGEDWARVMEAAGNAERRTMELPAVYEYAYIYYTPATAWVFEEIAELAGYVIVDDTGSLLLLDKWHALREEVNHTEPLRADIGIYTEL